MTTPAKKSKRSDPAPAAGDGQGGAADKKIQLLLEACRRALRYSENVANAEGVYFDHDHDLPFIASAIATVENDQ